MINNHLLNEIKQIDLKEIPSNILLEISHINTLTLLTIKILDQETIYEGLDSFSFEIKRVWSDVNIDRFSKCFHYIHLLNRVGQIAKKRICYTYKDFYIDIAKNISIIGKNLQEDLIKLHSDILQKNNGKGNDYKYPGNEYSKYILSLNNKINQAITTRTGARNDFSFELPLNKHPAQ